MLLILFLAFHSCAEALRPKSCRRECALVVSFLGPPHCLKKKATSALPHCFRISRTHSGFIGRHPGPDSPPTTTQEIPSNGKKGMDDKSGSSERNLT